jgi:hypothetical protein
VGLGGAAGERRRRRSTPRQYRRCQCAPLSLSCEASRDSVVQHNNGGSTTVVPWTYDAQPDERSQAYAKLCSPHPSGRRTHSRALLHDTLAGLRLWGVLGCDWYCDGGQQRWCVVTPFKDRWDLLETFMCFYREVRLASPVAI